MPLQPRRSQVFAIFLVLFLKILLDRSCSCNTEHFDCCSMNRNRYRMYMIYLSLHLPFPKKWRLHIAFHILMVVCNSLPSEKYVNIKWVLKYFFYFSFATDLSVGIEICTTGYKTQNIIIYITSMGDNLLVLKSYDLSIKDLDTKSEHAPES